MNSFLAYVNELLARPQESAAGLLSPSAMPTSRRTSMYSSTDDAGQQDANRFEIAQRAPASRAPTASRLRATGAASASSCWRARPASARSTTWPLTSRAPTSPATPCSQHSSQPNASTPASAYDPTPASTAFRARSGSRPARPPCTRAVSSLTPPSPCRPRPSSLRAALVSSGRSGSSSSCLLTMPSAARLRILKKTTRMSRKTTKKKTTTSTRTVTRMKTAAAKVAPTTTAVRRQSRGPAIIDATKEAISAARRGCQHQRPCPPAARRNFPRRPRRLCPRCGREPVTDNRF
ncbi:hypothetical protein B0T26DRAFT_493632 [Lasiosphaeria miniovina]|uniref:Uncharacterized protein n=1 Tax=Lasiosphaeria miniovina TaxID=1954250 RepID=A0AA40DKL2_9PEZI|nr:uncharacterized protein B0T26DRAFT_493632 [Lasiosphaeria miniovina]KAK0703263.1 hypothetical protein B0T26DRAFT_493632 [Lasiosphaeria miniovina]